MKLGLTTFFIQTTEMKMKHCLLCVIVWLISACSSGTPKEELNALLNNPKYNREIHKKGYLIRVTYLPLRYFELRQMIANDDPLSSKKNEKSEINLEQRYNNGVYFLLSIAHEDKSKDIMSDQIADFSVWSENMQNFYFNLGEFVCLETGIEKEIKLSVYDFQNTFGYTKDRKFLLCFPKEFNGKLVVSNKSDFVRMRIRDWGWGIGKQYVEWSIADIE